MTRKIRSDLAKLIHCRSVPDIFISYSRKDSESALSLTERLRLLGMDVWIDQRGIEGATNWSEEIVEKIDSAKVFLLLLSDHSQLSTNVVKEVSLAYDSNRKILPVDLERTELTASLRYQLAGIQRVPFEDFNSILKSLQRLGVVPVSLPEKKRVSPKIAHDSRKSLIVLPFEDLSPEGDNAWFADGLTGELIDALSRVKALRLIDRKTAMDLKDFRGKTMEIAEALQVRYFIEGNVRKYGDQIKISVQLLDIETGDYLWQESRRGEFKDIFDLQEEVALRVTEGLHLTLTRAEKTLLEQRVTENAEAYEIALKALEYFNYQTREGYQNAALLMGEAMKLDPSYANAYQIKARALLSLYRNYDRSQEKLTEAESLVSEALRLRPDLWDALHTKAQIYQLRNEPIKAEETAISLIRAAPDYFGGYFSLAFFYLEIDRFSDAITMFEKAVGLSPNHLVTLWNLVVAADAADDQEKRHYWADFSYPIVERLLKLHPDSDGMRLQYVSLLFFAGRVEAARDAAPELAKIEDPMWLYSAACLYVRFEQYSESLGTFRKALLAGFKNTKDIRGFLLETEDVLHDDPDFVEVKKMAEEILSAYIG